MARRANGDRNPLGGTGERVTAGIDPTAALLAAGLVLEREWKQVLSIPPERTGRFYGTHQASAPGEPPAPDTGALRNSVGATSFGDGVRVGSGLEYAAFLEFGTFRMAPRPHARPALEGARKEMGEVFVSALKGNF